MNLDIIAWKPFIFGSLIDEIYKAKAHPKIELSVYEYKDPDNIPFVSRTDANNCVDCYVSPSDLQKIEEGNAIAIGDTTSTISYQPEPFGTGDHMIVIRAKWLSFYTGIFIVSLLRREKFRYSYGRAYLMDSIKSTELLLPATADETPDWLWMENYIKSLHYKPVSTKVDTSGRSKLNEQIWEKYLISEIFTIQNGKGVTQEEIVENPGMVPTVQSGEENNGIIGFLDLDYAKSVGYTYTNSSCLTVARSGTAGCIHYFGHGCIVGDSAKLLQTKESVSEHCYLFLATILKSLRYKYSYGRKVTEDKYVDEVIVLPSLAGRKPDWAWIDSYMKTLSYSDRLS